VEAKARLAAQTTVAGSTNRKSDSRPLVADGQTPESCGVRKSPLFVMPLRTPPGSAVFPIRSLKKQPAGPDAARLLDGNAGNFVQAWSGMSSVLPDLIANTPAAWLPVHCTPASSGSITMMSGCSLSAIALPRRKPFRRPRAKPLPIPELIPEYCEARHEPMEWSSAIRILRGPHAILRVAALFNGRTNPSNKVRIHRANRHYAGRVAGAAAGASFQATMMFVCESRSAPAR